MFFLVHCHERAVVLDVTFFVYFLWSLVFPVANLFCTLVRKKEFLFCFVFPPVFLAPKKSVFSVGWVKQNERKV